MWSEGAAPYFRSDPTAGLLSAKMLQRLRPHLLNSAGSGKRWLGVTLLALGLLVLTGIDKQMEAWAVDWLPEWTTRL